MNIKVFVSSTWEDLQPERDAVERVVHRMAELEFSGMEHFGSSPRSARDESLERVDAADVYVGIFGGRYGSGITEEEYRRALERNLPCLLYFKAEEALPEERREKDPERIAKRAALHAELRDSRHGHLSSSFSSPEDLAAQVAADLHNWLFKRYLTPALTAAAQQGRFPEIREIVERTRDRQALRLALEQAGVAVGEDLVDGLLALGNAAIVQIFVQATAKLPTDYDARFRNYFTEYLGTSKKPVPFGGRLKTLEELDAWLDREASPPYLLLTAGAGRGKSALLVHWGRKLLTREALTVIHVPVSIRFRTNLAAVVFAALAAQLAEAHGEEVPADVNTSVEVWRGLVSDYLQRPLADGRRLVVILDGLDEAADWQAGADLFPFQPPAGLRLVVSARHISEAPDSQAWRRRLGWEDPGLAHALDLDPLDREGVADVLQRMGFPLDELGKRVDVVAELHRLSDGDPLLVRLYVDDLWKRGQAAARLRPEDLRAIKPGLEGYFDRWWKEQRMLWGDDAPLQEKGVQALLSILTCAFGPLTRDDLLAVATPDSGLNSWTLEDALLPLARFVVGDGIESGYVFSHPRFALYLHTRLNRGERQGWDERFIAWGRSVLQRLASRDLPPDQAPAYLVQYLGLHLERSRAPLEDFLALASEGWKLAWAALEGGYSGFVNDVDRAWRLAADADRKAAQENKAAPYLQDEIYLALCRASVLSLASRMPPVLLARLVEAGVWRPAQALAYARQLPNVHQRAEALSRLARHLPERQRREADEEALDLALSIGNLRERAHLLASLVSSLDPPPIQHLVETARSLPDESLREHLLFAAALVQADQGEIRAAFDMLQSFPDSFDRATTVVRLTLRLLDAGHFEAALRPALEANARRQGDLLQAVALRMAARGDVSAMRFLTGILPRESTSIVGREIESLLRVLASLHSQPDSFRLSLEDASWLAELVRASYLSVANEDRHAVLLTLQPYVDEELRKQVRTRVMEGTEPPEPDVLTRLALLFSGDEQDALIAAAFRWVRESRDSWRILRVLYSLGPASLSGSLLAELQDLAADLPDYQQSQFFRELASRLALCGQPEAALPTLERIQSKGIRAEAMVDLHGVLPEEVWIHMIRTLLPDLRPDPMGEITPQMRDLVQHFPGSMLPEAVSALTRIGDLGPRAIAHAMLCLYELTAPDPVLDRLVEQMRSFAKAEDQIVLLLVALFSPVPVQRRLLPVLLELVQREEQKDTDVVIALYLLADQLPEPDREPFRTRIWDLLQGWNPGSVLSQVSKLEEPVPERFRSELAQRLSAAAERIQVPRRDLQSLAWAVDLLPPEERESRALALVRELPEGRGAGALRLALRHLPKEALHELAVRQLRLTSPGERSKGIAVLAPYLDAEGLQQALVAAQELAGEEQALALTGLLPYLPADDQSEILRKALSEGSIHDWANVLGNHIFHSEVLLKRQRAELKQILQRKLTPVEIERLVRAGEGLDEFENLFLLHALSPAASAFDRPALCRIVQSVLRPDRHPERRRLLMDLAGLAPVLAALGGEESIPKIKAAVEAACELFP